ncbi:MAG: DUF4276 family protein [Verrucomicrobia bacterium]|nr:DUF4276 family protein [Verrucomicrobiota bacterium]
MPRLLIHVEGETEESFVNEILAGHLYACGYEIVSARLVGNARLREKRGGIRAWSTVKKDILNHLKEDPDCLATTMVDYYGLPQTGEKAWPGRAEAGKLPYAEKADCIEKALFADLAQALGGELEARRFAPFVVMHEFEGLLFSDCEAFAEGIGRPQLAQPFREIRQQFATPEEINDSPITAPSKRVEGLVEGYEKPLLGTLAVLKIGLETIRGECPHFKDWLARLEAWPKK